MNKFFLVPSSLRHVTKYLLICYLVIEHSLEILVMDAVLIIFNIFSFEEYKSMIRNGCFVFVCLFFDSVARYS